MKRIYIVVIVALLSSAAYAQENVPNDSAQAEASPKSTLTVGVSYANNVSYYGQSAVNKTPYLLGAASWRHRSGLYMTGAAYKLLNDGGGAISASSLGLGVDFKLGEHVSADLSYAHTFYPDGSPFVQAANANNATASLAIEKWLTTNASVDYAFGKSQDLFASLSTSKLINLGPLFDQRDVLSFTPAIEVVGGTQHFYKTYITEKRLRDSIAGIPLPPLVGSGDNETSSVTTRAATSFGLISYNFKFPLAYSRANYQFQLAYQLSILDKNVSPSSQTNSFFSASFYYQF